MKEGFAAHLIKVGETTYKSAIVLVDQDSTLLDIIPLNRETPFTRFFDGLLQVVPFGEGCECAVTPVAGERVSVWQQYPYDLHERCVTASTRMKRLK